MYLETMRISNFRGLSDMTVHCHPGVNVLVGPNNTGKTAILDALRLCLGIGNDQPDIFVRRDDYHVSPNGEIADSIAFDLTWQELTDEEKGVYSDMLALSSDGTAELQLHVRFEYDSDRERSKRQYWGGEKEGQNISAEVMGLLEYVHLGALRDATRDLAPGRGNQLSRLFLRLTKSKGRERLANEANEVIRSMSGWRRLLRLGKGRINQHLAQVSLRDSPQEVDIDFVEAHFRQIAEGLKVRIPRPRTGTLEPQFFNIWQNGLGYNNLIYITTVLGDLLKRRARLPYGSISLLIEEPEAHLHPQLQDVLFRYLQEIESQHVQVFLSSHSPTITAKTHLDSLIVLCDRGDSTLSTPVGNIDFEKDHKHFLQRFLDVTKCQLFFANSVVLVEGISEALLLPSFARAMGDEFDLDRNGVEVVNIGGVAFEPFARLFNAQQAHKRVNARCAILTDDDRTPSGDGDSQISNRAENAKRLAGGLLDVFLARLTFEYELFLENDDLIVSTYQDLHPGTDLSFAGTLEEKAVEFVKKIKANRDKAVFAQILANKIEDDSSIELVVPEYIKGAIQWATRGQQEGASVPAAN